MPSYNDLSALASTLMMEGYDIQVDTIIEPRR